MKYAEIYAKIFSVKYYLRERRKENAMNRRYEKAELEVLYFAVEDVVTASDANEGYGSADDVPEKIPLGTENMQGGGSVGIDWND